MLAQVQALLNLLAGTSVQLTHARGAGRPFELLLMANIAVALRQRGYVVDLLRSDGIRQRGMASITFIQRGGGPGPVRPASAGPGNPTSIVFKANAESPEWEIWNGIEFVGRSAGTHEFDIAIIPKELGDLLRSRPSGGRPFGHGWVSIECKHVAASGSPDEMRTFVARVYDTTILRSHGSHIGDPQPKRIYCVDATQKGFGGSPDTYYAENRHVLGAVARTGGFSVGTAAIANYYNVRRYDNLAVGAADLDDFTTEICDWIDSNL